MDLSPKPPGSCCPHSPHLEGLRLQGLPPLPALGPALPSAPQAPHPLWSVLLRPQWNAHLNATTRPRRLRLYAFMSFVCKQFQCKRFVPPHSREGCDAEKHPNVFTAPPRVRCWTSPWERKNERRSRVPERRQERTEVRRRWAETVSPTGPASVRDGPEPPAEQQGLISTCRSLGRSFKQVKS